MDRRTFLQQAAVAAGVAQAQRRAEGPMLVANPKGNYRFVRGGTAFSSGGVADQGYQVVHAIFATTPPYRRGFEQIDRHLKQHGRPPQALCGIELRSPKPFTNAGFGEFNVGYVKELEKRGVLVDGANPVARTNVAPDLDPPAEVGMYAFSYTAPATGGPPSFVVAGAGELRAEGAYPDNIVARGDVSPAGLRAKADHVLGLMDARMRELGVGWASATSVAVYTVFDIFPMLQKMLLPRLGAAKMHGVRWYFARPPIEQIDFEVDVHGCPRELVIG